MTKQIMKNIQYDAYDKMVKRANKMVKAEPITDKMVTQTLQNLLKGIK